MRFPKTRVRTRRMPGWGLGVNVTRSGWSTGCSVLVGCGLVATLFFAFTWNAGKVAEIKEKRE